MVPFDGHKGDMAPFDGLGVPRRRGHAQGDMEREDILEEKTVGENMVSELGLNPALGIESNQRLEKLREQHAQDAEKETKEEDI